ncbi:hypothetical protein BmR1_04g06230 [Babesia microti strain RI]|uniref:GATA-type domain-containing protein n=1 Tax=Babesia microti (strain RI) TaxID=1133968 RepID=I7J8K1_BABMR|nr:hypothetical protein BmR1_04g06230 [Babesia microti strain RI]CCF75443.1 hypothetical protein BmR1_04g06230 [Babesia microti strain RI]|eukprot:XP_012649851.1 hypothetical protein BmR1_04g06230 [Babesia microti strain RI]
MEMSDTYDVNVYKNVKDHDLPNTHDAVNNGYNSSTSKAVTIASNNSVEKSIETNGFVLNLDKPYYVFCEDKVGKDEMIKPLIDYSMTNLYEPLQFIKKHNIQQYDNLQPYADVQQNNFLYHQVTSGYGHTKASPQSSLSGYGEQTLTHTYNNVIPYDTRYQQQYNGYEYANYSPNVNYNGDKSYTRVSGDKCSTESSDHSEANKSCKDIASIGDHSTEDHSTIDNHSDNAVSNVLTGETANEEDLPFGNLISRYSDVTPCLMLSNEASIQSNETVQSSNQKHPTSPLQVSTTVTNNTSSGLKYAGYNNYYYNDQITQPIQRMQQMQGAQNVHLIDYKTTYLQQMYNTNDLPMDASVYNWQWPMYKIPQNVYQQHTHSNANYPSMYSQRLLYNKTAGGKWNIDDLKDKPSRLSVKRGKNSSAGRPRLNRSDYACSKCRARATPQWRYLHGVAVCNACYMRARKERMRLKRS